MLWTYFYFFGNTLKFLTMHQDASGCVRTRQNASERVRTHQNSSSILLYVVNLFFSFWQHIKVPHNASRCIRTRLDASESVRMRQSTSVCVRAHQDASEHNRTRQNLSSCFNSVIYRKGNRSMYYWVLLISWMMIMGYKFYVKNQLPMQRTNYIPCTLNIGYPLCF